ncbi:MAG: TIR domain-containing protein [Cellulosilyticaceae bacterium]
MGYHPKVFISFYYDADYDTALKIVECLDANNISVVPLEQVKLEDNKVIQWIDENMCHVQIMLLIISERTHERAYVHYEIGKAVALGIPIVPVSIGTYEQVINPLEKYCIGTQKLSQRYPIISLDTLERMKDVVNHIKKQRD